MKFANGNDYIDIIIYIVIMVVGLLASAYRNYAKKKEIENRQPGEVIPGFPEVEFEPVFEYEKPKNEEPVYKEIVTSEPESELVREIISTLDTPVLEKVTSINDLILSDAPIIEGEAVFKSTAEQLISDNINDLGISLTELQPDNNDILKGEISDFQEEVVEEVIDLEEAVIHSEILRTKYFSNSY